MKKATSAQLKQWSQWNEDWEDQKIIDSILLIPKHDRDTEILNILARAYNNKGQFSEAIDVLLTIPENEQIGKEWNYRLAYAYFNMEDWQKALIYFKIALSFMPDNQYVLDSIAECNHQINIVPPENLTPETFIYNNENRAIGEFYHIEVKLWGSEAMVIVRKAEKFSKEVLDTYLPLVIKKLLWIKNNENLIKEKIFSTLDTDTLNFIESHIKKTTKIDDKSYRPADGELIILPITKEWFLQTLQLKLIQIECQGGKAYINLMIVAKPDYLARQRIDVDIDEEQIIVNDLQ